MACLHLPVASCLVALALPPSDVPFFYISLATASGARRAARLRTHCANLTQHLEHVPAVDGNASARAYARSDLQLARLLKWNTPSEIGCTMSHVKAVLRAEQHCAAAGCSMAVILEDDVTAELVRHWTADLHGVAATLPDNWAVLQLQLIAQQREWEALAAAWRREPNRLAVPHDRRRHFGTGAYLIHRRGMQQLLHAFRVPAVPAQAWLLHESIGAASPTRQPEAGALVVPSHMSELQADVHLVYSLARPAFLATPLLLSCVHSETSIEHASAARLADKGAAAENELAHEVSPVRAAEWAAEAQARSMGRAGPAADARGQPRGRSLPMRPARPPHHRVAEPATWGNHQRDSLSVGVEPSARRARQVHLRIGWLDGCKKRALISGICAAPGELILTYLELFFSDPSVGMTGRFRCSLVAWRARASCSLSMPTLAPA
jgi:GR25 family glycosyltransferase involved in LPS biosynthesis